MRNFERDPDLVAVQASLDQIGAMLRDCRAKMDLIDRERPQLSLRLNHPELPRLTRIEAALRLEELHMEADRRIDGKALDRLLDDIDPYAHAREHAAQDAFEDRMAEMDERREQNDQPRRTWGSTVERWGGGA